MEHGQVTSILYDDGVVYCNIKPVREDVHYEAVPVMKPHSGFIQVPSQGDVVTMEKLKDGTRFISNIIARRDENPDQLNEGELIIQLDNNTKIYFKEQSDGSFDVNLTASNNLTLESNGRIDLNAPNGVYVNGTEL